MKLAVNWRTIKSAEALLQLFQSPSLAFPFFGSSIVLFLLSVLLVSTPLHAQEAEESKSESDYEAATTSDPAIPVDHLDLLLDPLTKAELLAEVEAWQGLLKSSVSELSLLEIESRKKKEEIEEAAEEESEPAVSESTEEEELQEEQDEQIDELTELRTEKAAILERFQTTVDAYELKGGDPEEYRLYAKAVTGIKVEVTDTNATWKAIVGWLKSEEGGVKWGLRSLQFLVIVFIFWLLGRLVGAIVHRATEKKESMSNLLKDFLRVAVRRVVLFIGILVALSSLGVNIGAMLALIGGGAFILGFALQDTLSNFAAGMMLIFYRPFDVGDAVEVGSMLGKAHRVSLVNTTLLTFDNKIVLVPNNQVWGQVITNITGSKTRRIDMMFGISYGDDISQAKSIIEELVTSHELVLKDPEPVVAVHELGDSSINFICRPWAKTEDYWAIYWALNQSVKEAFDAAGITIPFPQRDIHFYQEAGNHELAAKSAAPSPDSPTPDEPAPAHSESSRDDSAPA